MANNLMQTIEAISREKNLEPEVIIHAIEDAMVAAARKHFKSKEEIRARFIREKGEIEVFCLKTIVSSVENPGVELSLEEARELDPDLQEGDVVEIPKPDVLGRIAAQIAKQVIIQRVRDAEKKKIYDNFKDKEGSLITGTVKRYEDKNVVFDIGEAEAYLPPRDQIPGEGYPRGERMRLYVVRVNDSSKDPQIVVSRAHENLVCKLFELEVPEIYEGTVQIKGIVREPGERTKIAVYSRESDVDPVGACVGMKGSRIMTIIKELRGEKIDIIEWAEDPVDFAVNALSPAEIVRVLIKESPVRGRVMEVIVDNDNLSLAIGKKGQNVRLAARLIGCHIDIKSEEEKRKEVEGQMLLLAPEPAATEEELPREEPQETITPAEAEAEAPAEKPASGEEEAGA